MSWKNNEKNWKHLSNKENGIFSHTQGFFKGYSIKLAKKVAEAAVSDGE